MFGCGEAFPVRIAYSDTNNQTIDLITYFDTDVGDISAHELTINFSEATISLSQSELFRVSGEMGWLDRIYPLSLSGKSLVLPYTPVEVPASEYSVVIEGELYYDDYILVYDYEQSKAEIVKGGQLIATLFFDLDDTRLIPNAFFIDDENNIAILCNTEGDTFDKVYPVTLIYSNNGESFLLEKIYDYNSIFNDNRFSKINMPNYTILETNIHGNAQSKAFLWNEGANFVEINPYNGTVNVVLTEKEIKADIPFLDTHREFYEFFTGVGYQNGIYIAKFPNYNNLAGVFSVFYSSTGEYLGSVLCSENYISFSGSDNKEIYRIEDAALKPLLFIPQKM